MKTCARCKEIKSHDEFGRDKSRKDGLNVYCKICFRKRCNEYRERNPKKLAEIKQRWIERNPDKRKLVIAKYNNSPKRKEILKRYEENNIEKIRRIKRNWKKRNPEAEAERRAIQLKASPAWRDKEKIKHFYQLSRKLSEYGTLFHVDHIIPLKNKKVCGLHCEFNLQVITAARNVRKKNTYEVT